MKQYYRRYKDWDGRLVNKMVGTVFVRVQTTATPRNYNYVKRNTHGAMPIAGVDTLIRRLFRAQAVFA